MRFIQRRSIFLASEEARFWRGDRSNKFDGEGEEVGAPPLARAKSGRPSVRVKTDVDVSLSLSLCIFLGTLQL